MSNHDNLQDRGYERQKGMSQTRVGSSICKIIRVKSNCDLRTKERTCSSLYRTDLPLIYSIRFDASKLGTNVVFAHFSLMQIGRTIIMASVNLIDERQKDGVGCFYFFLSFDEIAVLL